MDEQPKCSHDSEPMQQKPTQKDQLGSPKDQSSTSKTQTVLTEDQSQPAYSKDQSAYSKTQNVLMIEQSARPREPVTPTKQKIQITLKDESSSSKEQANLLKLQITLDESCSSKDQSTLPKIQAASTKDQSASLKNQVVASIGNTSGRRSPRNVESGLSFCIARVASTTLSYTRNNSFLGSYAPLIIRSSTQSPITTQPRLSQVTTGVGLLAPVAVRSQPQSLFLQALSKLNESSLTLSVINHLKLLKSTTNLSRVFNLDLESGDITPPDSLTSAPPSYSFVLRQMTVRRRPRFMGTFYPSPSFVQHTPPPTYTTAFDVYIEPALPPPPARVYTFGFAPMLIVCPECGFTGMTVVTSRITICTHLCAFILCLLCCWICAPLPYILRSCKDVYHYCRNCRSFLGMYCPTNPDSVYP